MVEPINNGWNNKSWDNKDENNNDANDWKNKKDDKWSNDWNTSDKKDDWKKKDDWEKDDKWSNDWKAPEPEVIPKLPIHEGDIVRYKSGMGSQTVELVGQVLEVVDSFALWNKKYAKNHRAVHETILSRKDYRGPWKYDDNEKMMQKAPIVKMRVIEAKGKGIPELLAKLSAEDSAEFEKKKVEYEAEKECIKEEKEEEKVRKAKEAEEAAKKAAEEEAADKEAADEESSSSAENHTAMPPGLEDDVSDMEAELGAIQADGGSKPAEFLKKETSNPGEETEVVDEENEEEESDEKKEEEGDAENGENEEEKHSENPESPEEEVAKIDYDILDQETFMAKADKNAPEIIYTSTVLLLPVKDPLYPEKDLMKLLYRDPVLEQTLVDSEKQSLSSNTSKRYLSSKREEIGDRFVVLKRDYCLFLNYPQHTQYHKNPI